VACCWVGWWRIGGGAFATLLTMSRYVNGRYRVDTQTNNAVIIQSEIAVRGPTAARVDPGGGPGCTGTAALFCSHLRPRMSSLISVVRNSNPLFSPCCSHPHPSSAEFLDAIRSVNPPSRWKILVIDEHSQQLLNSVLKQFDILEENVTRALPMSVAISAIFS
jgi:hypothetical protein